MAKAIKEDAVVLKDEYRMIVDEYFVNGFNGNKAVAKFRPNLAYNYASILWTTISKQKETIAYISERRREVSSALAIKEENILVELMNWLRADATDYLGLTPEELKALPSEVKRCIQSISYKEKDFTDNKGNPVKERVMTVKIVDKLKALEMINKHINFYDSHNKSKAPFIDISKADADDLYTVMKLVEGQAKDKTEITIDV